MRVALAAALLLAGAAAALAQQLPEPITGNLVPQGSPLQRILPQQPPSIGPGAPPVPPATVETQPPAVAVPVRSITVQGASAYGDARLARITAGLAGAQVPLARIEQARLAILALYRDDGYALTTVTARLDPQGALRFVVVEGRIAEVKLEGDIGPAGTQVLRFLRHLTNGSGPVNNAALERWLLLANDIPGVTVRGVLQPSTTEPGALTLVAQVSRQAFNGLLTADNRAFRLTGPNEGLLVLDANSFTEFGERSEVSLYHTDGGTQTFGQASTEFFVGDSGLRMRLYGGQGQATPSGFLRDIDYHGYTTVFGLSAAYPLIRTREQSLTLSTYLDAIESEIKDASGPDGQVQRQGRDSLRVGRIGASYVRPDLLAGGDRAAVTTVNARLSQGLPFLGGTHNDDATATRIGEQTNFTKLAGDITRTQTLFSPFAGATVALRGLISGQYSNSVIPPAEKFFLGGSEITRGFYAGQATGDRAYAWTAELQLNTSLDLVLFGQPLVVASQFYAFYDRGEAWQSQAGDPNFRLSSEGIGARFNLTRFTEFDVEGDIRNTRLAQGTSGVVRPDKADVFYWRVLTRF